MSIKLAIAGRPTIALSDENITLGSDPSCAVSLPESSGAMPKHAVIRKIAGRWLIEVREAEAVFVGDSEPKRLVWLNPGDVIRLSEGGPSIIFQSSSDEGPPTNTAPQPSNDDPLPIPSTSVVILPPDSDAAFPVTKPRSSASIRVPKPPSSSTIKTPKAPSSGTIKATKPPSSSTIRSVNPSDPSKPTAKLSRSNSEIPVAGAPLKRRTSQVTIPTDDDVALNVPTLQRLSSWDDDVDPSQRRGLSEEQAEIRWIMMVVGRSVGAGLVVVVLWLMISWAIKSMNPTSLEAVSPASQPPVDQNLAPISPSPQVQTSGIGAGNPRAKNAVANSSDPPKRKTDPEQSPAAAVDDEPGQRKPKDRDRTTADGKNDRKPDSRNPLAEVSSSDSGADSASGSPAMRAVKDGIYAVVVEDPDKSKQIQVGTAWAASRRYLVTSATVVSAIEEQGLVASVVQVSTGKSFRIKRTRLHDTYRKASESADEAREQRNASRLAAERATQVRFDLGVLDVGRIERLPKQIASFTDPLDDSKESAFIAVGLPFQQKEGSEPGAFDENSLKERRCKKPTAGGAPQNKDMELTIQFGPDSNGRNWSGSPVLNKDHKVIGVYSQIPSTGAIGGKPMKTEYGVAWIGRLHEFASDVE